jgi:hypothetical protein
MAEVMVDGSSVPETKGLSQVERVVDTFVAPSKTFTDILRSTSWWLPFLILMVATMASSFAIDQKIGFERVAEQTVSQSASTADQMAQLTPDARAAAIHRIAVGQKYGSYAAGIIILLFVAIIALLNWASLNFGLGARTTYGQNFAVCMYAGLPKIFIAILNVIFVYAGVNTENFDMNNPVGTNLGYYMTDSAHWLRMALSFFDIFGLWTLALSVIGLAIISKKSKGQAAIVAVGWWLIGLLIMTGITAARG